MSNEYVTAVSFSAVLLLVVLPFAIITTGEEGSDGGRGRWKQVLCCCFVKNLKLNFYVFDYLIFSCLNVAILAYDVTSLSILEHIILRLAAFIIMNVSATATLICVSDN